MPKLTADDIVSVIDSDTKTLKAQKRHPYRPAHVHALIYKPGYKTLISQLYADDDPNLGTDAQFGVTRALIGDYVKTADDAYSLEFTFVIEPGDSSRPRAPITEKAKALP